MRFLPTSEALRVANQSQFDALIDLDVAKDHVGQAVAKAFRERYDHDVPPAWLHQVVEKIEAEGMVQIHVLATPPTEGTSVIVAGELREVGGPVRTTHRFPVLVQEPWAETWGSMKVATHAGWDLDTGLMVFEVDR